MIDYSKKLTTAREVNSIENMDYSIESDPMDTFSPLVYFGGFAIAKSILIN